ncbi:hypothetical protein BN1013_01937 [Candidatus Rubidus massiliensis]|nr:hypothetical protein BN1013_01937 [Candidatus Rubidus massiliensis]
MQMKSDSFKRKNFSHVYSRIEISVLSSCVAAVYKRLGSWIAKLHEPSSSSHENIFLVNSKLHASIWNLSELNMKNSSLSQSKLKDSHFINTTLKVADF